MECNLIKVVKTTKTTEGKDVSYTNYYLQFPNGVRVPVCARYYDTEGIKEPQKADMIRRRNIENATYLKCLSDTIEDYGKDK